MIRILICPCGRIQTSACRKTQTLCVQILLFSDESPLKFCWIIISTLFHVLVCLLERIVMDVESAPNHCAPPLLLLRVRVDEWRVIQWEERQWSLILHNLSVYFFKMLLYQPLLTNRKWFMCRLSFFTISPQHQRYKPTGSCSERVGEKPERKKLIENL